MDNKSLAHTTWNCKYHIVFTPKYRRQIIYGQIKVDVGRILRQLCERKGVEIIEATACGWRTFQCVFRHGPVPHRFTRRANHQLDWWF